MISPADDLNIPPTRSGSPTLPTNRNGSSSIPSCTPRGDCPGRDFINDGTAWDSRDEDGCYYVRPGQETSAQIVGMVILAAVAGAVMTAIYIALDKLL